MNVREFISMSSRQQEFLNLRSFSSAGIVNWWSHETDDQEVLRPISGQEPQIGRTCSGQPPAFKFRCPKMAIKWWLIRFGILDSTSMESERMLAHGFDQACDLIWISILKARDREWSRLMTNFSRSRNPNWSQWLTSKKCISSNSIKLAIWFEYQYWKRVTESEAG
jgi:hypothetical protein